MLNNQRNSTRTGMKRLLPYAILMGVLITTIACGTASLAAPAMTAVAAGKDLVATSPAADGAPKSIPATGATAVPGASQLGQNPKCDALFLANYDMGNALARMVTLTASTDYSAYTTPDSPFYLDFKKLRSDLDTLATLPDPSAADALIVGKPSEAITYFQQLMDLAETDIKNQGKPFADTSPSGVKLIGIDTPWEQHAATFGVAMGNVCKNYTAPATLFSGAPAATLDPQSGQINNAAMATLAAAAPSLQLTVDALTTSIPDQPTETPVP